MTTPDTPRFPRSPGPRALALVLAALAGCVESPILPQTIGSEASGPASFATPTPQAIATPRTEERPVAATPTPGVPATPPPTPVPTPTPVGADESATDAADVGEDYEKTGRALDLAISGPGYFVLSTKQAPESVADLLFTRSGALALEQETDGALSVYRLRHGDHAFHVVGFQRTGAVERAPAETEGGDLAPEWDGQPQPAMGLSLDADRNAEAPSKLAFDYTGKLRMAEADPRSTGGAAMIAYVALAQFASPEALSPLPGFAGVFRYRPEAGTLRLGVAVSGEGRTLGTANLILTGTLEQGD